MPSPFFLPTTKETHTSSILSGSSSTDARAKGYLMCVSASEKVTTGDRAEAGLLLLDGFATLNFIRVFVPRSTNSTTTSNTCRGRSLLKTVSGCRCSLARSHTCSSLEAVAVII